MTTTLHPYPAYQESGVLWLGDVPEHWDLRPLKHWVQLNGATLPETTDPDYQFDYLEIGSVGTGFLTAPPQRLRFESAPSRARRVVGNGDTIISTVRTYLKAIWHAAKLDGPLICSTGFSVLTPRDDTLPEFVSYLVRCDAFTLRVTADSVGIAYPAIAETQLGSFQVWVPPLPEQRAIVRYLNYMDRRIRRYIRAKQRLIKLLEEEKQAIIHRAVTGQIDVRTGQPYPEYKPSGVEWLGDVPAGWEVRRLKTVFAEVDNRSSSGMETLLSLRMREGLVPHAEVSTIPISPSQLIGYKIVRPGQMVMNRMRAAIGLFGVAGQHGLVSPDYAIFTVKQDARINYFLTLFKTPVARDTFRIESKGLGTGSSGFMRLYTDRFGSIRMPSPPPADQLAIVDYIGRTTADVDAAIDRAHRQIALLQEYRTRLVADVVTGKLDVREAAASLPDELDDMEPLDELEPDDDEAGEELDEELVEAEV